MIAPCRFDDDSSQMRVAGFSDASASGSFATESSLAQHRNNPSVASTAKAGYLANFGRNGHSRDICDTAQACRSLMTCCNGRGQLDRLSDGSFQSLHPFAHVLDFVQII